MTPRIPTAKDFRALKARESIGVGWHDSRRFALNMQVLATFDMFNGPRRSVEHATEDE